MGDVPVESKVNPTKETEDPQTKKQDTTYGTMGIFTHYKLTKKTTYYKPGKKDTQTDIFRSPDHSKSLRNPRLTSAIRSVCLIQSLHSSVLNMKYSLFFRRQSRYIQK